MTDRGSSSSSKQQLSIIDLRRDTIFSSSSFQGVVEKKRAYTRDGTSSTFSSNELLRVTQFEPGLVSGSEIMWLELDKLLKFFELYLSQVSIYYTILSPVEPANKFAGLG